MQHHQLIEPQIRKNMLPMVFLDLLYIHRRACNNGKYSLKGFSATLASENTVSLIIISP